MLVRRVFCLVQPSEMQVVALLLVGEYNKITAASSLVSPQSCHDESSLQHSLSYSLTR